VELAHILIAATADDVAAIERILGDRHELCVVGTMSEAEAKLKEQVFDLIMVGVHFDESRMFELVRNVHKIPKNDDKPVICFCTRDTALTRTMHESIDVAAKALGAWMYLDQHEFNVVKDPDAELRRIIERCLTGEARKRTQANRVDSHKQREELQRLREALEGEEWSEDLEDRVVELRRNLAAVVLELCSSKVNSLTQQEEIASSRDQRDRVSESVHLSENGAMRQERRLSLDETKQTVQEVEIGSREETKRNEARRKPDDDKSKKQQDNHQD
jgi:response regulator RpfG family c-di-GMP phosphodiesterase